MRGHAEVDDLSFSVTDHKPGVQQSEPSGRNDPRLASFLGLGGQLLTQGEFDDRLPASASKEAGIQRREIVVSSSRCRIAGRILHGFDVQCETEYWAGSRLPPGVDPSSTEGKRSMMPG